jgi:hypothetical protein
MDPEERVSRGSFATAEEALAECRRIVDACLEADRAEGHSADELYTRYQHFGEDPWIAPRGDAAPVEFSAWEYAKQRCREICNGSQS